VVIIGTPGTMGQYDYLFHEGNISVHLNSIIIIIHNFIIQ